MSRSVARHKNGLGPQHSAGADLKLLIAEQARCIMLIDCDNNRFEQLEHLFQHGLKMYTRDHVRADDRTKLFGQTNDKASNLSSAAATALGALPYCVNTAVGAGREPVARVMCHHLEHHDSVPQGTLLQPR